MRLDATRVDREPINDLLLRLVDLGVDCVHTSNEYGSFDAFRSGWRHIQARRPNIGLKLICKVSAPSFGEAKFDAVEFERRIDDYLRALNVEHLDVVQWLFRGDLQHEDSRTASFDASADVIGATVDRLRQAGKLGALVCFPYTRGFADRALTATWCDGLTLYVNPLERDLAGLLDTTAVAGKSVIAIRPFAAGRVLGGVAQLSASEARAMAALAHAWPEADQVQRAIFHALAHPVVATTIATVNTLAQADSVVAAATRALPDRARFRLVAGA